MSDMCKRGLHDMSNPADVYMSPRGWRQCRACIRANRRTWRALPEGELIGHLSSAQIDRFWSKAEVAGDDECWLWQATINYKGYGQVGVFGVVKAAHRVAYLLNGGVIPDGLQIDHLCRVRSCVNPRHLEPVSQYENQIRSPISMVSTNIAKTHCPHGHPYDDANTHITTKGGRSCRTCRNACTARIRRRQRGLA
jgi:HNH endonuclease